MEYSDNVVKVCKKHGPLTEEQVFRSKDKNLVMGFAYKCKRCSDEAGWKRPCPRHGDLKPEERISNGRCKICAFQQLAKANEKRNSNRDWFNEKQKLKRKANPEKFEKLYKEQYLKKVEKYGEEHLNDKERSRRVGLTIEQLRLMIQDQDNKCAICFQSETRLARRKSSEESPKLASLCIDHNHTTGQVRGLLCHSCNTAIGKMKDDITLLQSAIDYLRRHEVQS